MTLLERLERGLGDPWDASNPFSFAKIMKSDDDEEFPRDRLQILDRIGLGKWLVPSDLGGSMTDLHQMITVGRAIARRDTTVALAKGVCVLASLPVWIEGNEAQKKRLAEVVGGSGLAAFGLTEQLNGSDLARTTMQIRKQSDGSYVLDGEKWLINNATESHVINLLVKSDSGLSVVFIDKEKTSRGTFAPTPKIRLMGVKGLDVSGIRFTNAAIHADSLVGREGRGLEIAMKTLMVSRLLCVGLVLGTVETALRLVFEFCEKRQLYDGNVLSIPNVRSRLVSSLADFHLSDLYGRTSARALSIYPEQASLHSANAKYLLPEIAEKAVREIHVTLGARYYLAEDFVFGLMQKIARDVPLIGLFDGSSQVTLYSIANQLPAMAGVVEQTKVATSDEMKSLFVDSSQVPLPDFKRLRLTARGEDVILSSFLALDSKLPGVAELKATLRSLLSDVAARPRGEATNQRFYFEVAKKIACLRAGAIVALDAKVNSRENSPMARYLVSKVLVDVGVKSALSEGELRSCEAEIFNDLARRVRGEISFGLEEGALPGWYGRLTSPGFSK